MAGETVITIIGNLTADPELRFLPNGTPVASFTIASTPRHFDRESQEWSDGPPLFLRCSAFRQPAEYIAESLTKGMRVIAQGRLQQRSYEDREGIKRTVVELGLEEVGPSLKYATAAVAKTTRRTGADRAPAGGQQPPDAAGDPWSDGSSRVPF